MSRSTVRHETLLQRMEKMYGVQQEAVALAWLSSYFNDRSQSVIIQDIGLYINYSASVCNSRVSTV